MKYVPVWFPGAGWKRFSVETAQLVKQMVEEPFQTVKEKMVRSAALYYWVLLFKKCIIQADGTAPPSMTSHLLNQGYDDTITRDVAGIAYAGMWTFQLQVTSKTHFEHTTFKLAPTLWVHSSSIITLFLSTFLVRPKA